jgi:hypothetical protein
MDLKILIYLLRILTKIITYRKIKRLFQKYYYRKIIRNQITQILIQNL